MQRPNLSNLDPEVVAYIEYLEKKVELQSTARAASSRAVSRASEEQSMELAPERASETLPAEQETTVNVVTVSQNGLAKRTYRHLFTRQHRGGMGVFGMDIDPPDQPTIFTTAEENQHLLLFTNRARVFRHPLNAMPTTPVFAKGAFTTERLVFESGERIVGILPEQARGYVALASETGRVRCLRHHLFGEHMRPGTALYNYGDFGPLASVCWTPGDAELFLVTKQGIGIRFAEKALSPQGDQGIKLSGDDRVVGVTAIFDDSSVFLLGADGRGTLRLMNGFAPNKSPGGSGKIAFKNNKVLGAAAVESNDDVFIISRLGKVIRFPADEIPSTEGVVQGVNCMSFRSDEAVAFFRTGPIY